MSDWGRGMLVTAGVDLGGGSEEALAVAYLNDVLVADLFIRAAWNDFEKIAVRPNRSRGYMAKLFAGHMALLDGVVHPINLNVELKVVLWMVFGVMLSVFVVLGRWYVVVHKNLLLMLRYHDTILPRHLTSSMSWCKIDS
jgi:hypothetical protein